MARRPQMDMCSELRPSVQYMQWYYTMGKPYLLGGQSTIIPPHVQRSGVYEPVVDIEPDPQPDAEHDPEPDAEHDPEPEPEAQPEAESEDRIHNRLILLIIRIWRAVTISWALHLIHIRLILLIIRNLRAITISRARHRIHIRLILLIIRIWRHNTSPGPYPPHYSSTPGPYPLPYSTPTPMYRPQHGTPPGSSSSVPFESHEFFSMYQTPSLAAEEDVGRRNHPQRERRPPQKYTPRTTPSNHQF
ncbi:hypothetical protein J1N35_044242 [Gossypium stocksii]|uniref:Uncharacterized protein n=1 Tax=Gossypium stocksii TaxID=47602 RepID=A0A9D3U8S0_9ROSI|nr:hypothetical protein J1N35_044242 [Gossypium stocksii]